MAGYVVTGGAGFIGSQLVEELVRQGHNVTVLDNFSTGTRDNLTNLADAIKRKQVFVKHGEILDVPAMRGHFRNARAVFHLAAFTSVPGSNEKPADCYRTNIVGTECVLEAATEANARRVVFTSSAAVYGINWPVPNKVGQEGRRQSPYATSKWAGEDIVLRYAPRIDTVCLRLFNVYGPRQRKGGSYAAVIPAFIDAAVKERPIVIEGDGNQTRDFIHVRDVVQNLVHAATAGDLSGSVFNLGSGKRTRILDLADLVANLAGSDAAHVFTEPRKGDIADSYADMETAKRFGFGAGTPLEIGIHGLVETASQTARAK